MNQIKDNIKKLRKENGMTQDQLAERLNVTHQAISNWETGKTQPDIETLKQMAQVWDISVEEIIYGEPKESKIKIIRKNGGDAGVTLGATLAVVISYTQWKSIGWAIFHGILGWVYVLYYVIRY